MTQPAVFLLHFDGEAGPSFKLFLTRLLHVSKCIGKQTAFALLHRKWMFLFDLHIGLVFGA